MVTNFFPITLPFKTFQISRLPYSPDKLQELRITCNQSNSFFRHADFIYISPMKEPGFVGGEPTTLAVESNPEIVGSLIRHILFRSFKAARPKILPLEFAPLSFLSVNSDYDLARPLLPEPLRGIVMFLRLIEISVRLARPKSGLVFGLVISIRHRWEFHRSVQELVGEGYNVEGKQVSEAISMPGLEDVLAPEEAPLGTVKTVAEHSVLIQTASGPQERDSKRLFLRRSRHEIGNYLAFKLGKAQTDRLFALLRDEQPQRLSPSFMLGNVQKMAKWLSEQTYQNLDSFCFKVSPKDGLPGDSFKLEPTKFIFGLTPGSSADSILGGLWKHGPYDRSRFDRKSPRILAIFHRNNRGYATNFLGKLINGIPESQFFKKGFRDLFRLHEIHLASEELDSHSASSYDEAITRALRASTGPFDLAIVETFEETKSLAPAENPYFRAKSRLMANGIPVQCVLESRLKGNDQSLANWLGPIALQLYAKLGGVPWVLPASPSVDREIVVGIGSAVERKTAYSPSERSRIVGLTTFFSGEGRYLLGQQLRSVPYDEYFYELLGSLEQSIAQLALEYGWKKGDNIRLVFHVFKPMKNIEVEVVDQLVRKYSDYHIKHAFVTISHEHPFMMFQSALQDKDELDVQLCERGQNIILDNASCLVQLRGPKHVRTNRHRFPTPILVQVHQHSTYHDLQFIVQQILDFSWASWRSFAPANTPVTIFYSTLIAQMTRELRHVPGWTPDVLNTQLKSSKWFL